MKREMAIAEWRRAAEALGAAEALMHGSYHADSVSRAYYAIMHAAKAALVVREVEATSHAGVKRMFGLHLVRPGEIEPRWSSYLGEGLDDRLEADYNVFVSCFGATGRTGMPARQRVSGAHAAVPDRERPA